MTNIIEFPVKEEMQTPLLPSWISQQVSEMAEDLQRMGIGDGPLAVEGELYMLIESLLVMSVVRMRRQCRVEARAPNADPHALMQWLREYCGATPAKPFGPPPGRPAA